jgi:hypothetical protein
MQDRENQNRSLVRPPASAHVRTRISFQVHRTDGSRANPCLASQLCCGETQPPIPTFASSCDLKRPENFIATSPPPTPRSEATVCAVTGVNIAELAATAFVAPLIVLLSVRTIGYRGEQCGGGESVSQSSLMYKLFFVSARGNQRS